MSGEVKDKRFLKLLEISLGPIILKHLKLESQIYLIQVFTIMIKHYLL